MRFSALAVDFLFLFPPIYLLSNYLERRMGELFMLIVLLKPDVILIDHGHFQYNSLILGLILLGFYLMLKGHWYAVCVVFTLAVHAKQMAVYYALAFLAGLVGLTYQQCRFDRAKFMV